MMMKLRLLLMTVLALGLILPATLPAPATFAQEADAVAEGKVIDFARDIAPLFSKRCLECHNAEEAKGDFRVDDPDAVAGYVEAGDSSASALLTDYMMSQDPDMLMPPESHGGPLSAGELALVKVWIDEGANWPAGATVLPIAAVSAEGAVPAPAPAEPTKAPKSLIGRVWSFQGFFHPAVVHFPVALLLVGALFVFVGWFHPQLGDHVALSCLMLGAASSVVASAMGWSFASTQGYGSGAQINFDSEAFWHRWSGVVVTTLAVLSSMAAIRSLGQRSLRMRTLWKTGLIVCGILVGLVGHQGGELTYGEAHYHKAFDILFGNETKPEPVPAPTPPVSPSPAIKADAKPKQAEAKKDETATKPAPEKQAPEKPAPEKPAPEKPAPEKPAPEKPAPPEAAKPADAKT